MGERPTDDSARCRLVASAQHLFHAASYGSVGVQELCDHAGVRRGSFYYYFHSKQELGLAVIDAEWESLETQLYAPAFADDIPAVDRFDRFFDLFREYYEKRSATEGTFGGCPLVNISEEMGTIDPEMRERVARYIGRIADYFRDAIKDAVADGSLDPVDSRVAARRVTESVLGGLVTAKAMADLSSLDRMKRPLAALVA
jgi:TetR/AcrR family transcriptional repressor of nem operon